MPLLARSVLGVLAGVGAALSFEPYHWVYLLPLAVASLTLSCAGTSLPRGFLVGAVFGIAFMLVLLPWLQVIGVVAWVALAALEGLLYGFLGLGTAAVTRLAWWPLWTACLWVGVELLRATVPFGGFPWGRLAFATIDTPVAPLFGYVGSAGVTFAVALLGTSLAWASTRVRRTPVRALAAVAVTAALVSIGSVFPVNAESRDDPHVRIAAVQGNVPGTGLDAFAERRAVLDNHVAATRALAERIDAGETAAPDVVVWPENSSDIDPYSDPAARSAISGAVRAVGAPLLMGAAVGDREDHGWRNRAIVWSPSGTPGAYYDKLHPVPFGEYIPFRSLLAPRVPALDQIPSDMVPGRRAGVLDVGAAQLGVLMCFEVGYDGLLRNVVDGGAEVVVVPTNNATYTGTGQISQQFAMSRLRAIETGRSVVVASTNGITGIIAPDGRVVARAPVRTQDVLVADVGLSTLLTPAIRYGAWLEWLLTVAGAVAVSVGIAVGLRRGRRPSDQTPAQDPEPAEPALKTP